MERLQAFAFPRLLEESGRHATNHSNAVNPVREDSKAGIADTNQLGEKRYKKTRPKDGHYRTKSSFRPDKTYSKGRKERKLRSKSMIHVAVSGKIFEV